MTAWIDRGALKMRFVGSCLWARQDEMRYFGNITAGTVHTVSKTAEVSPVNFLHHSPAAARRDRLARTHVRLALFEDRPGG